MLLCVDVYGGAQARGTWASVVVAFGLRSCGAQTQWLLGVWNLPGPGIKRMFLALAGGFLSTESPGKSQSNFLASISFHLQKLGVTAI